MRNWIGVTCLVVAVFMGGFLLWEQWFAKPREINRADFLQRYLTGNANADLMWVKEPIPQNAKADLLENQSAGLVSSVSSFKSSQIETVRISQDGRFWLLERTSADPRTKKEDMQGFTMAPTRAIIDTQRQESLDIVVAFFRGKISGHAMITDFIRATTPPSHRNILVPVGMILIVTFYLLSITQKPEPSAQPLKKQRVVQVVNAMPDLQLQTELANAKNGICDLESKIARLNKELNGLKRVATSAQRIATGILALLQSPSEDHTRTDGFLNRLLQILANPSNIPRDTGLLWYLAKEVEEARLASVK